MYVTVKIGYCDTIGNGESVMKDDYLMTLVDTAFCHNIRLITPFTQPLLQIYQSHLLSRMGRVIMPLPLLIRRELFLAEPALEPAANLGRPRRSSCLPCG